MYKPINTYVIIKAPEHPQANVNGCVAEHRLIAEEALGKLLPPGTCIHHLNEDKSDNRNNNLVICESDAYHKLLHARTNALRKELEKMHSHGKPELPTIKEDLSPDIPHDISITQAAAFLQISERTLMKLVKEGKVGAKQIGRRWWFAYVALRACLP